MRPAWLKRAWIWWANPIDRSAYFTEEYYQEALRRRRQELRPIKIGTVLLTLGILGKVYPQSLVVGTLIEFAFFALCGAIVMYLCLVWYEGERLPQPPESFEYSTPLESPEWERINKFSTRIGIVIGIIAVLFFGPITPEEAIQHLQTHSTGEDGDDSSMPP